MLSTVLKVLGKGGLKRFFIDLELQGVLRYLSVR